MFKKTNKNNLILFFLAFILIVICLIVVFQSLNVKQTTGSNAAVGRLMPPVRPSQAPFLGGNGSPAPTIYLTSIPNPDFEQWQNQFANQRIPLYWKAPYAFRYSPPSPTLFSQSSDSESGLYSLLLKLDNQTNQLNLISDVFHLDDGVYDFSIWSKLLSGTPTATIHLTKGIFYGGHYGNCRSNTDALAFTAGSSQSWTNTTRVVQIKNESTTPTPPGANCPTNQYFILISVGGNNSTLLLDNFNLQKKL